MAVSATHRGWVAKQIPGILAAVYNGAMSGATAHGANTALDGVLIGTPVTPALAVDSIVLSDAVASGDFLLALNRGGSSENYIFGDGSAGTLYLYAPNGAITLTPTSDVIFANGTGIVIGHTSQETISTGDGATDLIPEAQIMGTAQADSTLMLAQFSTTNAQAAMLAFVKGGNAAIGTHTTVADDEYLGRIVAFADDGTDLETPSAEIRFVVDGTPAGSQVGGSIEFYTTPDGSTTLTAVMTLNSAQNVIVGNGNGLVVGYTLQETVSTGDGATDLIPEVQVWGTAMADASLLIGLSSATDALGPCLAFVKSGNAAIGTHTALADNEYVGRIVAFGDDGTDLETPVAEIRFVVDDSGGPGTGAIGGSQEFYTTADGGTTLTIAMTLDTAQNVRVHAGLVPHASDGAALGTTALMWADLFLASAGVINFNNGNVTITHAAGVLTVDGAAMVFNEASADLDFRIESNDNANMFMLDAGLNAIGIGAAAATNQTVTVTNAAVAATGRVMKLSGTIAAAALTDGYGAFEVDITLSGSPTDHSAAASAWINITGGTVPAGTYICARNDGIYEATAATITNAKLIFGARMHKLFDDTDALSFPFSLNTNNTAITAVFDCQNFSDFGTVANAGATAATLVPFLRNPAGTLKYVLLYDLA